MKRKVHENGLTLAMFVLFALSFAGQYLTGWKVYNDDQREHRQQTVGYTEYLRSGHFVEATFENWESEFLQMAAFVMLTIWLRQKGSPESKELDGEAEVDREPDAVRRDAPGPVHAGALSLALYKHSLSIALLLLFAASFTLHALGGAAEYNQEQVEHGARTVSTWQFLGTPQFWFQSFQNWQSEFLSVGTLIVLTIFLRQKGSSQSKPVDAPHAQTGEG